MEGGMLISIYPMTCGEHCEMKAEANIPASGPFDSPEVIVGRLLAPAADQFSEIVASEVLFEGEVYAFRSLNGDGTFELRKAW
jgi:hypothetical protein